MKESDCDLEFKLVCWRMTHRQDDVDRVRDWRQVSSSQGHLETNQTDVLGAVVLILFCFLTYCIIMILHEKSEFILKCKDESV